MLGSPKTQKFIKPKSERSRSPATSKGGGAKKLSDHEKLVTSVTRYCSGLRLEEVVAGTLNVGQDLNQMRRLEEALKKSSPGCAELVSLTSAMNAMQDAQLVKPGSLQSLNPKLRTEVLTRLCPLLDAHPEPFKVGLLTCAVRSVGLLKTAEDVEKCFRIVAPFPLEEGSSLLSGD